MSDFSLDDPSFYEDFLVEAQEHFEMIEQNFLTLEEDPGNLDILNAIFRSVHTIKGASGFLGLAKVQSLSHIGENILDELRKGRMSVIPGGHGAALRDRGRAQGAGGRRGHQPAQAGRAQGSRHQRPDPPPGSLPERRGRPEARRRPKPAAPSVGTSRSRLDCRTSTPKPGRSSRTA